jgi:RNA processing factor Prp31
MLAAKASLAIRYDALGEGESNTELAFANRGKIENRLKMLEKQQVCKLTNHLIVVFLISDHSES